MHAHELHIDEEMVQRLIDEQFPEYTHLRIKKYHNMGTVNAIYRLGAAYYIRLPRVAAWADIEKEWKILHLLQQKVSLTIPSPIGLGHPTSHYPLHWAIYKWIEGRTYAERWIDDEVCAAKALANFVNELHAVDMTDEIPRAGRKPLRELHELTLNALESAQQYLDTSKVMEAWNTLIDSSPWKTDPVFIHSDLLRTNIVTHRGKLHAIIDFGASGKGDPAFDVIAAWTVFNKPGRDIFLNQIHGHRQEIERAMGYALHQAVLIIPYYYTTYHAFAKLAIRTVHEILRDLNM
jgi:aminoglycoside phosphotransferase (APT) family kinase protein